MEAGNLFFFPCETASNPPFRSSPLNFVVGCYNNFFIGFFNNYLLLATSHYNNYFVVGYLNNYYIYTLVDVEVDNDWGDNAGAAAPRRRSSSAHRPARPHLRPVQQDQGAVQRAMIHIVRKERARALGIVILSTYICCWYVGRIVVREN